MGLGNGAVAGFCNDGNMKSVFIQPAVDVFFFSSGRTPVFDAVGIEYGVILLIIKVGAVFGLLYSLDAFCCPSEGNFLHIVAALISFGDAVFHQIFDQIC